ncbi:hypothetical protein JCM19274_1624 [Algibacter lectus]|uniref:Glycosyl transferase family 1 domain-containing protein n=1 Tax=Algibacter lectus TaxID=221126 RepID=A0A090X1J8_9FLAO|nr:hypothetical protein JCM19274_1624 [Algibacter lectus]
MALLEYGLANLAVVATNVGECNQIIKNKNTGLLVSAEDSNALGSAIMSSIEDLNLRRAHAKQLTQLINTDFSETRALQTIVNTYTLF